MRRDALTFAAKLLLFAAPIVCGGMYVESGLRRIPNTYSTKRQNLERQLDQIHVLVLGDSWAASGIDPAFFRVNGYSLAFGGQSIWYDVALAQRYVDRMPALRAVIFAVSYLSLGYQLDDSVEGWRKAFYWRFWDIQPPTARLNKWDDRFRYSLVRLYDKDRVLNAVVRNFAVDFNMASANGWVRGAANSAEISETSGRKRVKVHDAMIKDRNYEVNRRALSLLLDDLVRRNVSVVFVTPPVFETYYKYTNETTRVKNAAFLTNLCEHYGCQYHDYLADARFGRDDFANNDHLNRRGAEKFSTVLDTEVIASLFDSGSNPIPVRRPAAVAAAESAGLHVRR